MSRLGTGRGSAAPVTSNAVPALLAGLALLMVTGSAEPALAQGNDSSPDEASAAKAPAKATTRGAGADDRRTGAPTKPSDAPIPSCLTPSLTDQLQESLQPRGVQKRDFLKNKKLAIRARGGLFAADLLSSSYLYGGSVGFFLTEDFALEVSFDVTPLDLDLDKPLAEFFGDARFQAGTGYLALANLVWTPMHAKLKIAGGIVHSDIMFMAGAGRLFHDSVQGVTFDAGMAIDFFFTRWMTLRLDVRDVIAVQEAVAETRLTNNILTTLGVVLWIPTGL